MKEQLFNISESQFEELGYISLDSLYVLEMSILGVPIRPSSRCDSFIKTLRRKGLVSESGTPTEEGKTLYNSLTGDKTAKVAISKLAIDNQGLAGIHKKLQTRLHELTGFTQMRPALGGKNYNFLCNEKDLTGRLTRVIAKYKLTDFKRIETVLIKYIEHCYKTKNWFPILEYYILKDGESKMVTDLETISSPTAPNTSEPTEIYI